MDKSKAADLLVAKNARAAIKRHEKESAQHREVIASKLAELEQPKDFTMISDEERAEAASAAAFEEQMRSLEEQLDYVKTNAPRGRQAWGGAQAPERGAVRGRTLPPPPHVYGVLHRSPRNHPGIAPINVIKPTVDVKARPARQGVCVSRDNLTPGQRNLHVRRPGSPPASEQPLEEPLPAAPRIYPSGFTYESASSRLDPGPAPHELRASSMMWPMRAGSPTPSHRPQLPPEAHAAMLPLDFATTPGSSRCCGAFHPATPALQRGPPPVDDHRGAGAYSTLEGSRAAIYMPPSPRIRQADLSLMGQTQGLATRRPRLEPTYSKPRVKKAVPRCSVGGGQMAPPVSQSATVGLDGILYQ